VVCDPAKADGSRDRRRKSVAKVKPLGWDGKGFADGRRLHCEAGVFADVSRSNDDLAGDPLHFRQPPPIPGRDAEAPIISHRISLTPGPLLGLHRHDVLTTRLPIYHTTPVLASNVIPRCSPRLVSSCRTRSRRIHQLMRAQLVPDGLCRLFYTRRLQSPSLTKEATRHMRPCFGPGSAPRCGRHPSRLGRPSPSRRAERDGMNRNQHEYVHPMTGSASRRRRHAYLRGRRGVHTEPEPARAGGGANRHIG